MVGRVREGWNVMVTLGRDAKMNRVDEIQFAPAANPRGLIRRDIRRVERSYGRGQGFSTGGEIGLPHSILAWRTMAGDAAPDRVQHAATLDIGHMRGQIGFG